MQWNHFKLTNFAQVQDPSFSLGAIIWKVVQPFTNIIRNVLWRKEHEKITHNGKEFLKSKVSRMIRKQEDRAALLWLLL